MSQTLAQAVQETYLMDATSATSRAARLQVVMDWLAEHHGHGISETQNVGALVQDMNSSLGYPSYSTSDAAIDFAFLKTHIYFTLTGSAHA